MSISLRTISIIVSGERLAAVVLFLASAVLFAVARTLPILFAVAAGTAACAAILIAREGRWKNGR
jgi:hypothetical protein